jgi:hypothetical protein
MEVDGIPLTGKLSATGAKADLMNDVIEVKLNVINKGGTAKIWLATTNNFKTGGKDNYKLMGEVPVANEKATISVKDMPSDFYKIVIEAPYNFLNRWIVVKKRNFDRLKNNHMFCRTIVVMIAISCHAISSAQKNKSTGFPNLLLLLASLKIFPIRLYWKWWNDKLFDFLA